MDILGFQVFGNTPATGFSATALVLVSLFYTLLQGSEEGQVLDEKCGLKSLYAISCIVRDYPPGLESFLLLNGPEVLLQCAIQPQTTTQRLRTKACFFVSAICVESITAAQAFSDMGLARQLLVLVQQEEHQQADEHVVKVGIRVRKGGRPGPPI